MTAEASAAKSGSTVVVGVDIGTGSARALAVDRDGAVAGRASAPFAGRESWPAGFADPTAWRDALARALDELGVAPVAIAIGSQSPTTVPLDGRMALTVRHPAGITLSPHDQHLAQRDVLASHAAHEGGRGDVCQLWDWLLRELGAPAVQTRWPGDPELERYGALHRTGDVVGEGNGSWGVPGGTPLVGGAQDAYLAFWAAGTDEPGRAVDPGGRTGGFAVAVAAGSRPEGMYALTGASPDVDIVGGPVAAHGLMLEWLASITAVAESDLLSDAASVPPGADGVVVLPYLEGERAPRWNRDLRAEIVGLSSEHTRAHLARAVVEGTAYGLRHIADELRAAGVGIDVVVCGGAPARSALWCEVKASVLGVPVEIPVEPDLAAYGAALAAGAGAGWWPRPGEGRTGDWPRPATTIVDPHPDPAYERGYERFVALGDDAVARLSKEAQWPTA